MKYSLDRFEESKAVLIDEHGGTLFLEQDLLPIGAQEGSVLIKNMNKFVLDHNETKKKREEVRSLLDELFR